MTVAVVWGSEPPAFSVGWCEPMWPGDSGVTVLFSDSPDPDELEPNDPRVTLQHLSCLLEEHPGLEHGVAVAQEHGAADLGDDGWVGRSVS